MDYDELKHGRDFKVSGTGFCGFCMDQPCSCDSHIEKRKQYQNDAIAEVIAERGRQDVKWGAKYWGSIPEAMLCLGEEFGELCEAVNETVFDYGQCPEKGGQANIMKELTQLAGVAVKMMEMIMSEGVNVNGNR